MFDTLLTMEASGGSSGGGGSEELIAYEVASITEKLSQRGRFDVPGIQMQYPVLYEESMNTVRISASHSDASFPRIRAVGRGRGATGEAWERGHRRPDAAARLLASRRRRRGGPGRRAASRVARHAVEATFTVRFARRCSRRSASATTSSWTSWN